MYVVTSAIVSQWPRGSPSCIVPLRQHSPLGFARYSFLSVEGLGVSAGVGVLCILEKWPPIVASVMQERIE
jgi:hypothetical protein